MEQLGLGIQGADIHLAKSLLAREREFPHSVITRCPDPSSKAQEPGGDLSRTQESQLPASVNQLGWSSGGSLQIPSFPSPAPLAPHPLWVFKAPSTNQPAVLSWLEKGAYLAQSQPLAASRGLLFLAAVKLVSCSSLICSKGHDTQSSGQCLGSPDMQG